MRRDEVLQKRYIRRNRGGRWLRKILLRENGMPLPEKDQKGTEQGSQNQRL
jgi:hypothetical protein